MLLWHWLNLTRPLPQPTYRGAWRIGGCIVAEMAVAAASRGVSAKLGLREIRIHLCQRSPGSQGVRDFIEKRYVELKKANPDLPILIRECSDVQPKLWARYGECGTLGWGNKDLRRKGTAQGQAKTGRDWNSYFGLAFDLVDDKKIYIRRAI